MHRTCLAIANSDSALLALLQELFNDVGYDVATFVTDSTTHAQIRALQPRLVMLDTGMYMDAGGPPLLKMLQWDPLTQRIPVLITTVDHRFVVEKAAFLQALGYDVVELPASIGTLVDKVAALLASEPHP